MITRKQAIEYFATRMDELVSCNYILADSKITNLLKTVTSSKLFYELITYTAENFNYSAYLNSLPKGEFFPTENKKNMIAFGFGLFTEIDSKNEDLLNVLSLYYKSDSFTKSYKLFADNFLIPFKHVVVSVAEEMVKSVLLETETQQSAILCVESDKADVQPKGVTQLSISSVQNPPIAQPTKKYLTCYKDIQKILITEKSKIINCRHLKDAEKSDLLVLLDRFKDCLYRGNKEGIKTSFISYKYAVLSFKKIESEAEDIERILKFCEVI